MTAGDWLVVWVIGSVAVGCLLGGVFQQGQRVPEPSRETYEGLGDEDAVFRIKASREAMKARRNRAIPMRWFNCDNPKDKGLLR